MKHTIAAVAVSISAVAVVWATLPASAQPTRTDPAVVNTDAGPVRGTVTEQLRTFQNIPYAAAPTGELRWAPPQPPPAWQEVRDATKPGPICAQSGFELGGPSNVEDCLSVNVTTPRATHRPLPVLVWMHGGAYKDGTGSSYAATRLSRDGKLVVVTMNYRLGALGFLGHPALGPDAGNAGLLDQQAALRWVQRNAAAFGGDAHNVTLAGESSGGTSVCTQLAAPGSQGLFQRAIMESNDCSASWSPGVASLPRSPETAESFARELAEKLGCTDEQTAAACLRKVSVEELRKASDDGNGVGPEFGTPALPENPATMLAEGRLNRVPVLHGINANEENLHVYGVELREGPTTLERYTTEVRDTFGDNADAVLAEYGCTNDDCAAPTLGAVRTDYGYATAAVRDARLYAAQAPVFTYEFNDPDAPPHSDYPASRFPLKAYHTSELAYLFDVPWAAPGTDAQRALSATMIGYWSRFAHTGDPNCAGVPYWAPGSPAGPVIQSLAPDRVGPSADFAQRHHLAFWQSLGY